MTTRFVQVFASVPEKLRERLQKHFQQLKQDHALGLYESSELNGGKLCEAVVLVLEWYADFKGLTIAGKPTKNIDQRILRIMACGDLLESFQLNVPDVLRSVYRIRNKRGVGHIAGDVEPNFMDSTYVVAAADWVMGELVRVLHSVTLEEATILVRTLTIKKTPRIWRIGDVKRVMPANGKKPPPADEVLMLLYDEDDDSLSVKELICFTEYSNSSVFRNRLLASLHKDRLVEFDKKRDKATLSPAGRRKVEDEFELYF